MLLLTMVSPEPANWATWYATDTSLVFIFQTYQVVPYAYGTPEFRSCCKGVSDFIK
ncbi:MAG: RsiV family protein [Candidatus Paceibacterota bacterium]